MAFEPRKKKLPIRRWALLSYPGDGKSTFGAQMRGPLLPIDSDHRFDEVQDQHKGEVLEFSVVPSTHNLVDDIVDVLKEKMPGAKVGTILVDSLTAILKPLTAGATLAADSGQFKNRSAAFRDKAVLMQILQDSVSMWGTDVLWIWHLHDSKFGGADQVRETIPEIEKERLKRNLNMILRIVVEADRRGICVEWARNGNDGMVIWDDSPGHNWAGMPERIEEAVYNLSFASKEDALAYAVTAGKFPDTAKAQVAYDVLKKKANPKSAAEMFAAWKTHVDEMPAQGKAA
jgi:hypothetical protein